MRSYKNWFLQELEENLSEFERKIVEEDYDQYEPGFDEAFNRILVDVQGIRAEHLDMDPEADLDSFKKRLKHIQEDLDLYDEEAELGMMFPNSDDEDEYNPYD